MQPLMEINNGQQQEGKMDAATEHQERYSALTLTSLICVPMAIRAAIKLGVFDIIAAAGPGAHLSPSEMAAKLPTTNPNAALALERILRLLVTNSVLTVTAGAGGEKPQSLYGLGPLGKHLVASGPGASAAASFLLSVDKVFVDSFYHLEEAVLEADCEPFVKAHGKSLFEYVGEDARHKKVFHEAMRNGSIMALDVIFDGYKGFEDVKEIVDVGGSSGAAIAEIVARYPHIRGRNFDLSYVIANAPQFPGVEHVAGNMFEAVPSSETIFMKSILHDWDDDQCIELLKNCWKALPEGGKVINADLVVPTNVGNDMESLRVLGLDLTMMAACPRGRERTIEEFRHLAKAAGFARVKDFPVTPALHVIEFHK